MTLAEPTDFAAVQALVSEDMQRVDALIRDRLTSDVALIDQVAAHLVGAGGKRLRPTVLLLLAGALDNRGSDAVQLAAVIEFIHTATLLHDDVVDASSMRRGRSTANALWGNSASILVGDFLYSRSFQMMVELGRLPIMRILADATNAIAEGEVLQLLHVHNPDTDEAAYLRVIERKTAVLFAAASELGALLGGGNARVRADARAFGLNLGFAFQIADDVLDYTADESSLGKRIGDDLAEGKATLPLIHALTRADAGVVRRLQEIVRAGDSSAMPEVLAAIHATGAIEYCRGRAERYAANARQATTELPDSAHTTALRTLCGYAVARDR